MLIPWPAAKAAEDESRTAPPTSMKGISAQDDTTEVEDRGWALQLHGCTHSISYWPWDCGQVASVGLGTGNPLVCGAVTSDLSFPQRPILPHTSFGERRVRRLGKSGDGGESRKA